MSSRSDAAPWNDGFVVASRIEEYGVRYKQRGIIDQEHVLPTASPEEARQKAASWTVLWWCG